jgi:LytS/YehU family sensor histidine kinase
VTASTTTSRMVSQIGRITGDDQNHEVYVCEFATRNPGAPTVSPAALSGHVLGTLVEFSESEAVATFAGEQPFRKRLLR